MAHAFSAGTDFYTQFLEGAGAVLGDLRILLPLLALGVLLELWRERGMVTGWPVFLAGQFAGIAIGGMVGPWIIPVAMVIGILTAALAALWPGVPRFAVYGGAFLTGACVIGASLEGHGYFQLPFFIHAGIFFGANLACAFMAGCVLMILERFHQEWLRIGWRITASWIGAILLLYLAFVLRG